MCPVVIFFFESMVILKSHRNTFAACWSWKQNVCVLFFFLPRNFRCWLVMSWNSDSKLNNMTCYINYEMCNTCDNWIFAFCTTSIHAGISFLVCYHFLYLSLSFCLVSFNCMATIGLKCSKSAAHCIQWLCILNKVFRRM